MSPNCDLGDLKVTYGHQPMQKTAASERLVQPYTPRKGPLIAPATGPDQSEFPTCDETSKHMPHLPKFKIIAALNPKNGHFDKGYGGGDRQGVGLV